MPIRSPKITYSRVLREGHGLQLGPDQVQRLPAVTCLDLALFVALQQVRPRQTCEQFIPAVFDLLD